MAQQRDARQCAVRGSTLGVERPRKIRAHLRVDLLGEARQIRATATIEVPCRTFWLTAVAALRLMAGAKLTK